MTAESAIGVRDRLRFIYAHYLAGLSFAPPRRGASTDLADKIAIILEQFIRHADRFDGTYAGEGAGRLWIKADELLTAFEVPSNVTAASTYAGRALDIPPGILGAFYPDAHKLYFRANARLTTHDEYLAWLGTVFPATRLIDRRWRALAQDRAGITVADEPFLGTPLSSQSDGKLWFAITTNDAVIGLLRAHVQKRRVLGVRQIDRWVFGSAGVHRHLRVLQPEEHQQPQEIELLWPTDGATLHEERHEVFRARVNGVDVRTYEMSWSIDYGGPHEMRDNPAAACKESAESREEMNLYCAAGRGRGPYRLTFTAKERPRRLANDTWASGRWTLVKHVSVYIDCAWFRHWYADVI